MIRAPAGDAQWRRAPIRKGLNILKVLGLVVMVNDYNGYIMIVIMVHDTGWNVVNHGKISGFNQWNWSEKACYCGCCGLLHPWPNDLLPSDFFCAYVMHRHMHIITAIYVYTSIPFTVFTTYICVRVYDCVCVHVYEYTIPKIRGLWMYWNVVLYASGCIRILHTESYLQIGPPNHPFLNRV